MCEKDMLFIGLEFLFKVWMVIYGFVVLYYDNEFDEEIKLSGNLWVKWLVYCSRFVVKVCSIFLVFFIVSLGVLLVLWVFWLD